jgi:hypothetical protein
VLYQKGWIDDPKGKAKSVVHTDEGARLAEDHLQRHFGAEPAAGTAPPNSACTRQRADGNTPSAPLVMRGR